MKCIHGLDNSTQCAFCNKETNKKPAKVRKKKPKSKPASNREVSFTCRICVKRSRVKGTRSKCVTCAKKRGYKNCIICKKLFIPRDATTKSCGCKKKGRGSVWVVASAGLPSLGRRR